MKTIELNNKRFYDPSDCKRELKPIDKPLTEKQKDILLFCAEYFAKNANFPSNVKIALEFNACASVIGLQLQSIVRKGYILKTKDNPYVLNEDKLFEHFPKTKFDQLQEDKRINDLTYREYEKEVNEELGKRPKWGINISIPRLNQTRPNMAKDVDLNINITPKARLLL